MRAGRRSCGSAAALAGCGVAVLVLLEFAPSPPPARAAGIRDLEDGWLVPPAVIVDLWSRRTAGKPDGAFAGAAEAATMAASAGVWGRFGCARLYGLAELPLSSVSCGFPVGALRVASAWQRLGRDLFVEELVQVEVALRGRWRPRLRAGGRRLSLAAERTSLCRELQVGISISLPGGTMLDLDIPLSAAPVWFEERGLRRWLRLRGTTRGGLWSLAVDRRGDGVPRLQTEAWLVPGAAVAVGLRAEPASGTYGVVTAVPWRSFLLRTSHLVHPALGPTHRFSVALGNVGGMW